MSASYNPRVILTWKTPLWGGASKANSGGGIRTRDLRVMSPTSYQTAPPRNSGKEVSRAADERSTRFFAPLGSSNKERNPVETTPQRALPFPPLGTWRSPVAHLNGVQGVAGSNPAVPTLEVIHGQETAG